MAANAVHLHLLPHLHHCHSTIFTSIAVTTLFTAITSSDYRTFPLQLMTWKGGLHSSNLQPLTLPHTPPSSLPPFTSQPTHITTGGASCNHPPTRKSTTVSHPCMNPVSLHPASLAPTSFPRPPPPPPPHPCAPEKEQACARHHRSDESWSGYTRCAEERWDLFITPYHHHCNHQIFRNGGRRRTVFAQSISIHLSMKYPAELVTQLRDFVHKCI